jgi:hypothetical protein
MELTTDQLLMAGFAAARVKDTVHDVVLAEVGNVDEGAGVRASLVPHYLLIEVNTPDDEGELWIPLITLLELIGELNKKVGS